MRANPWARVTEIIGMNGRPCNSTVSSLKRVEVWAMPSVTLDDPIEASRVALVNCHDQRLRKIAGRHSVLETFLNAFRNEFGTPIRPTIGMVRESAHQNVKTTAAFGGFRDAVCMSAVIFG